MIPHQLSCTYHDEAQTIKKLQDGSADLGFISPLSYAKNQGNLTILNDFIISSPVAGRNSLLFFKGKLETIDTIYFSKNSPMIDYHRIIARYVLGEIFNITADWKEVDDLVINEKTIEKYQVIFLSGHLAYDTFVDFENYIDLTEEWSLKMGLPMVHLILCGSRNFHNQAAIDQLKLAREIGLRNLMRISNAYANGRDQSWDIYFDLIDKNFRFFPEIADWESLHNLFQYMFYANVVEYLPEIHFYHPEHS
jgi:predicted solute-binding protein